MPFVPYTLSNIGRPPLLLGGIDIGFWSLRLKLAVYQTFCSLLVMSNHFDALLIVSHVQQL